MGWTRILPQLSTALGMTGFSLTIVGLILFAVVSLGIVNTLFMSLYERMFEFGVLRAVGTRPGSIFRLIVSEAAALAAIAVLLGIVLSLAALWIVGQIGIDYTGIEYAGVTFREKIYPVMRPAQFVLYPCCVFALTLLVSIYPATYAARLTPARAMRKSF
jgi:ABC-type lipoprotein release transport system permease subunit